MQTENLVFVWDATALQKLISAGVTVTAIAKHFGVSRQTVYNKLGKPEKENAPGSEEATGA